MDTITAPMFSDVMFTDLTFYRPEAASDLMPARHFTRGEVEASF